MGVSLPGGAEARLRAGELAILPTDTVYGIACAAGQVAACARLYRLKSRPVGQPTAVMLGSVAGLVEGLAGLPDRELRSLRLVLPGPVTLVVTNPARRFPHLCGDAPERIGVRVPRLEPAVTELADALGGLLITSANRRGGPVSARLADVPAELVSQCAVVVDGGRLPGTPSSVIDVTSQPAVLLRAGPDADALMAVLSA